MVGEGKRAIFRTCPPRKPAIDWGQRTTAAPRGKPHRTRHPVCGSKSPLACVRGDGVFSFSLSPVGAEMSRGALWTIVAIAAVAALTAILLTRGGEPAGEPGDAIPPAEVPPAAVPPGPGIPADPLPTPAEEEEPTPAPEDASEPEPEPETSATPFPEGEFGVRGTVTLPDGSPAPGAEILVHVIADEGRHLRPVDQIRNGQAGEDGSYRLPLPDTTAVYYVQATREGHANASARVIGPEYEGSAFQRYTAEWDAVRNLQLRPLAPVAGRVVYTDGEPAGGLEVRAWQSSVEILRVDGGNGGRYPRQSVAEISTTAAADGSFSLDGLTAGPFHLAALEDGRMLASLQVRAPEQHVVLTIDRDEMATVTITGTVLDFEERIGIGGARVRLVPGSRTGSIQSVTDVLAPGNNIRQETVANAAGRFRLEDVPHGTYRLALQAGEKVLHSALPDRYVTSSSSPTAIIDTGGQEDEIELTLTAFPGYRIAGQAVEAGIGEPVPGVTVSAESLGNPHFGADPVRLEAVTNERGRFDFANVVAQGTLDIGVDGESHELESGYATGSWPDASINRTRVGLRPHALEQEAIIELRSLFYISGRVVTPAGVPARDAEVNAVFTRVVAGTGRHTRSHEHWMAVDAEGRFRVPAPDRSSVDIRARRDRQTASPESVEIDGAPVEDIEIVLGAPGSISGRVIFPAGYSPGDPGTYSPVPSPSHSRREPYLALFSVTQGGGRAVGTSDIAPDGSFHFSAVSEGEYRISGGHPSFPQIGPKMVELEEGQHLDNVVIDVRDRGVIDLNIVDEEGTPVEEVYITFMIMSETPEGHRHEHHLSPMRPGAEGRIQLLGLTGEEYRADLRPLGDFETKRVGPFPLDGEPRTVVLEGSGTEEGAPVTVYLFDAQTGDPVPEDLYSAEKLTGNTARARLETHDGYFVDEDTNPRHSMYYRIEGSTYARQDIHVPPGDGEREAVVSLHRGSEVSGRVVPATGGVSVDGLRVVLYISPEDGDLPPHLLRQNGGAFGSAFTDGGGEFSFSRVPPGEAFVYLVPTTGIAPARSRLAVPQAGDTVDAGEIPAGPGGAVHFRVLNPQTGEPYTNMRVTLAFDRSGEPWHSGIPNYHEIQTDATGMAVYTNLGPGDYTPHAYVLNATPAEPVDPPKVTVDHGTEHELTLRAHMDPDEELVHASWELN